MNPTSIPRIHIVGRKNSGKTTLIVELVSHFSALGIRVGTIKHTHHQHELDTPGKDSFRHRQAGAAVVGILSPEMTAVFRPTTRNQGEDDPYRSLLPMFSDCDLVLVEGHSRIPVAKLEVWRAATGQPPLAQEDARVLAVISDDQPPVATAVWPRGEIAVLAQRILDLNKPNRDSGY